MMYMAVTADQYELPIAWADTADELARITGRKKGNLLSLISKAKRGKVNGKKIGMNFIKVEEDAK